ncbi:MAG: hypothetical protein GY841_15775 [FCB group bacterium]|nr:hypothetical protein [FCB group bacterium]
MQAVTKKINGLKLQDLIRLQHDELMIKNQVIARMENMLEKQANALIRSRGELTVCRAQLEASAPVA